MEVQSDRAKWLVLGMIRIKGFLANGRSLVDLDFLGIFSWYTIYSTICYAEEGSEPLFWKMTNVQLDDFRIQAWKKIMICQKAISEIWNVSGDFPFRFLSEPTWAVVLSNDKVKETLPMDPQVSTENQKKLSQFFHFQAVIKHRIYKFLNNLSCKKKTCHFFEGEKDSFLLATHMQQFPTVFSNASERWFFSRFSWKHARCNSDGWRKEGIQGVLEII